MNARINMKTTIQLVKPYNLLLSLNHQVSNKNFETETQCHSLCLQNDGKKLISHILCKYIALNLTYSLKSESHLLKRYALFTLMNTIYK